MKMAKTLVPQGFFEKCSQVWLKGRSPRSAVQQALSFILKMVQRVRKS
ncbi:hypothetical protein [Holdemania sp. Marseille-P2844]|nr:hypothetical protein [Holdemania sp. Marseille-P2844]